ncbi:hypothetical protein COO60DRAFT_1702059 [Scenedesmus sp. NREL 46B-D3]|nr:hypothetical protein COO60DRAFT_1702059 [Scenedesmus sp. NREL 46B-D3]
MQSRDTSAAGAGTMDKTTGTIAIGITGNVEAKQERMRNFKRRASCCIKVAPWVSAISCIMVGVGLGVWYVYTKRCLGLTQEITEQLFEQPLALVQLLDLVLGWTTLLMVIVVSCLLGITVFVSLLRTYQHSAVLPSASCASPGKLSYGTYAGFTVILNVGWWLLTIVVALMIAGNLVWLTVAFMFNSAMTMGVTVSTQPDVQSMTTNIKNFLAASEEVPLTVCPVNCFDMGSFYDTLGLSNSCICGDADMQQLKEQADTTWKFLVHVLAALALMGLGCLWQLMNASANFAHARRDMREARGRNDPPQFLTGDAVAAVHMSPYTSSKKATPSAIKRDQDAGRSPDTSMFPATTEFAPAMPEAGAEPAESAEHMTYNSAYETYQEAAEGQLGTPNRRASSPSPRSNEAEQASPGSGGRAATFNTTAQRYAAYRLRAAQAAAGKPASEGRKQWMR